MSTLAQATAYVPVCAPSRSTIFTGTIHVSRTVDRNTAFRKDLRADDTVCVRGMPCPGCSAEATLAFKANDNDVVSRPAHQLTVHHTHWN